MTTFWNSNFRNPISKIYHYCFFSFCFIIFKCRFSKSKNCNLNFLLSHDSSKDYCGGIYYITARSSGFNIFEPFSFSVIMSTFFWEYGIEAFAEIPYVQDLVFTPVAGFLMGEIFFITKKSIVRHDKKVLNSRFLE